MGDILPSESSSSSLRSVEEVKDRSMSARGDLAEQIDESMNRIRDCDVEVDEQNPLIGRFRGICWLTESEGENRFEDEMLNPSVRRDTVHSEWSFDDEAYKKEMRFSVQTWKKEWKPLSEEELRTIIRNPDRDVEVDSHSKTIGRYKGVCKLRMADHLNGTSAFDIELKVKHPKVKKEGAHWKLDLDALKSSVGDWHVEAWEPDGV